MSGAIAVERGCGVRKAGGVYAELGMDPNGAPVESFLVCQPVPVDGWDHITPVGVHRIVDSAGTPHFVDWVGSSFYPNVADFVEEARRFGVSRRLPRTLDLSGVTKASRLLLVHSRGRVLGPDSEHDAVTCPKDVHHGPEKYVDPCVGMAWRVVESEAQDVGSRWVVRKMPAFQYEAQGPVMDGTYTFNPAIFMSVPISRFVVVRDPIGGTHEDTARRFSGVPDIPVEVVDE